MAQISTIQLSDIKNAHRFDAEYFKPEYLEIEKNLKKVNTIDFVKVTKYIKKGIFDISPSNYRKSGIPFLRVGNMKNPFIDESDLVYLDEKVHNENNKTELNYGDIVLSKVGSLGDAVINLKFKKINFSQNNIGIKIDKEKINSLYAVSFFNSKYGKKQIEKQQSGQVQVKLVLDDIKNLKIPLLPESFQLEIEKIVKEAYEKQKLSKELYKEAEQILLEELDLVDYKPKHKLTFETSAKEIEQAHRFDAEFFQPKYKDIIEKIESYEGGFDLVENVLNFNKTNFFPENEKFYNYIPLSKVSNSGEIEIPEKIIGKDLPTRARRLVKKGDVILSSISGSLETSAIIMEEHENFIVSNGFYVFNSKKINSETLLILFKSKIMLQILDRISKGAILGGYDLNTFNKVVIPLIKPEIQEKIAEKVNLSHKLRKESKDLLEEAKRRVENKIEQI